MIFKLELITTYYHKTFAQIKGTSLISLEHSRGFKQYKIRLTVNQTFHPNFLKHKPYFRAVCELSESLWAVATEGGKLIEGASAKHKRGRVS